MSARRHPDRGSPIEFRGANHNRIAGELRTPSGGAAKGTVLLAHGGGQTRHAWRGTAGRLAVLGWTTIAIDQRGHGASEWVADGDYGFPAYAADLAVVADQLRERYAAPPAVVGASLGGIAALLAAGEAAREPFAAIVLVDVTPSLRRDGVARVLGFMAEKAEQGFASLEEAAAAIAAYLPHRPRPKALSGLAKNLRLVADGRYRWHWDPRFLDSRRAVEAHAEELEQRLTAAARRIAVPLLLVRGSQSELVGEAEARAFLALVPHAAFADVSGARHMVAGDENDAFTGAIVAFLGP